jgi:hypothetical protein
MPQLTPSQARVVNPVLSSIAQGIQQNDLVGNYLFPSVDVPLRGGQILTFGREAFMRYAGLNRAPGSSTPRVQFGYSGSTYTLVDYSIEGKVPIEIQEEGQNSSFSLDHAAVALNGASRILQLRLEIAQATLATTLDNHATSNRVTLSGTAQWSDQTSGVSNPLSAIETGKEAIRAGIGRRPNVGVMGPAVWASLKYHPILRDYTKYTGREVATLGILSELTGIPNWYVGDAVSSNDAGTTLSDCWGKDVVLAYTETAGVASYGAPTFGYTYNLSGYPLAEEPYMDRNHKSQFFPVTRAEAPVIAGQLAGYLIKAAVA